MYRGQEESCQEGCQEERQKEVCQEGIEEGAGREEGLTLVDGIRQPDFAEQSR